MRFNLTSLLMAPDGGEGGSGGGGGTVAVPGPVIGGNGGQPAQTPGQGAPPSINPAPAATPPAQPPTGGTPAPTPTPAAPQGGGEVNPYEAAFGAMFNPDMTVKEGWTENLPEDHGLDAGRLSRLARQGSFPAILKSLASAQDHLERRDGSGTFIPDASNENAMIQFRRENGIPDDPSHPDQGYNFKEGLPEGVEAQVSPELSKPVGDWLKENNVSKESAGKLIGLFNAHQSQVEADALSAFEASETTHVQNTHDHYRKEWGLEFDANNEKVAKIHNTYKLDLSDPRDFAAATNPKVIDMMLDLHNFSRPTATTPEGGSALQAPGGQTPGQQALSIMKANPNWKNDSTLRSQVNALHKQEAARKGR